MGKKEYFQSLIAGGATVSVRPERKNRLAHHRYDVLYTGPLAIPERIANIVKEHPAIKRTTHRKLVSRYAGDADGWVWLFCCQIPEHRFMVGEITRTPEGGIRVHSWKAADPGRCMRVGEPATIIAVTTIIAVRTLDVKTGTNESIVPEMETLPDEEWA